MTESQSWRPPSPRWSLGNKLRVPQWRVVHYFLKVDGNAERHIAENIKRKLHTIHVAIVVKVDEKTPAPIRNLQDAQPPGQCVEVKNILAFRVRFRHCMHNAVMMFRGEVITWSF